MGCSHTISKTCENLCIKNSKCLIDQYELNNTNGLSTNRDQPTNRSTNSEFVFLPKSDNENNKISLSQNHKFHLNFDRLKSKNNFEGPDSDNSQILNISEIKDGIDTNPQRRLGKTFIILIKEFNFIQKLCLKCLDSDKENEIEAPMKDFTFDSNHPSVSVNSSFHSILSENKYNIKSSILIENLAKKKIKEFFNKFKNSIYIPTISLSGKVDLNFYLKKDTRAKFAMTQIGIKIPLNNNVISFLSIFIENYNLNMNTCNLENDKNIMTCMSLQIKFRQFFDLIEYFKNNESLKIYFDFYYLSQNNFDRKLKLGISFSLDSNEENKLKQMNFPLLDKLNFDKEIFKIKEVISFFLLNETEVKLINHHLILNLKKNFCLVKLKNFIFQILLVSNTEVEFEFEKIDKFLNSSIESVIVNFLNLDIDLFISDIRFMRQPLYVENGYRFSQREFTKNKTEVITFKLNSEEEPDIAYCYEI